MKQVLEAAKGIQDFFDENGWRYCFIGGVAVILLAVSILSSQTPIKLAAPTVMDDVRAKLSAEPSIPSQKLADLANKLAARQGYGFGFDPGGFKERSVTSGSVKMSRYDLWSTDGKRLRFIAPERGDHPCGTWTEFPVGWVKGGAFGLTSDGQVYATRIPRQFGRDDIALVDRSLRKTFRRWDVPMDSTPEAISGDGTKIYLYTELDQLFLEVDSLGKYRYVASNTAGLVKNHVDLKKFPKDKKNDYIGYRQFKNGGVSYYIKFSWPCT